jgi:biotin carboxyl carrier protein
MTWEEGLERLDRLAAAATSARVAILRVEEKEFFAEVRRTPDAVSPAGAVPAAPAVPSANGSHGDADEPEPLVLRADLVGVVRLARPVVAPGTKVDAERDLAYVESLGIRTPVRAAGEAVVAGVLVEDGQAVDYGQALFAVRLES